MANFRQPAQGSVNWGLPGSFLEGFPITWLSSSSHLIGLGSCRDATQSVDIVTANELTPDLGNGFGPLGQDAFLSAANVPTLAANSTSFTASASIVNDVAPGGPRGRYDGTATTAFGAVWSSTTTLTGVSSGGFATRFSRDFAVGDLVWTANGAARVVSIASDSSITLSNAFPGGDIGSGSPQTAQVIESAWCSINSTTSQRINTISADGKTVVGGSNWNSGNTGTNLSIRFGTPVGSATNNPTHAFLWLAAGTSGTTACYSTQRTRPYPMVGYTAGWRRVGAFALNTSDNFVPVTVTGTGREKLVMYQDAFALAADGNRVLSAGGAGSWTSFSMNAVMPPTSTLAYVNMLNSQPATAGLNLFLRPRGFGDSSTSRSLYANVKTANDTANVTTFVHTDGAQACDYVLSNTDANNPAYVDFMGYVDPL